MFRTWCNRSDLPDLSFAHLSIHYVSREAAIVGMIVVNMTRSSFLLYLTVSVTQQFGPSRLLFDPFTDHPSSLTHVETLMVRKPDADWLLRKTRVPCHLFFLYSRG